MATASIPQSRMDQATRGNQRPADGVWPVQPGSPSDRGPTQVPGIPKTNTSPGGGGGSPMAEMIGQMVLQQMASMMQPQQPQMGAPQMQPMGQPRLF